MQMVQGKGGGSILDTGIQPSEDLEEGPHNALPKLWASIEWTSIGHLGSQQELKG